MNISLSVFTASAQQCAPHHATKNVKSVTKYAILKSPKWHFRIEIDPHKIPFFYQTTHCPGLI